MKWGKYEIKKWIHKLMCVTLNAISFMCAKCCTSLIHAHHSFGRESSDESGISYSNIERVTRHSLFVSITTTRRWCFTHFIDVSHRQWRNACRQRNDIWLLFGDLWRIKWKIECSTEWRLRRMTRSHRFRQWNCLSHMFGILKVAYFRFEFVTSAGKSKQTPHLCSTTLNASH